MTTLHIPILLESIVEALTDPFLRLNGSALPHWLVDCTLGGGGHCAAFLEVFLSRPELRKHKILALDQDPEAVQRASVRFKDEIAKGYLQVQQGRFGELSKFLNGRPVLAILADLGFSSDQLEDSRRGLSFQVSGPLDMRLNPKTGVSCRDLLNQVSEDELEKILREFGEENFSRRIAAAILSLRRKGQLPTTTDELVNTVVRAIPPKARHGRIHAATRTFQALRIAVNEELSQLDSLLEHGMAEIVSGGRIAVLSFHSLEDRKVKHAFRNRDDFLILTKKPIQADEAEIRRNPRSRSAKLRIGERI